MGRDSAATLRLARKAFSLRRHLSISRGVLVSIMRYISTRGAAPALDFDDVLLSGLARDGGLYVPDHWPQIDARCWNGLEYAHLAAMLMSPFMGPRWPMDRVLAVTAPAWARFAHKAVTPLVQLGPDLWLMELFHGPTFAFKDLALQILGCLFNQLLEERDQRLTIIVATSGDTGSAAIEAFRDRSRIDLFVLYPHGRISPVQRRQMTTIAASNVHALAIEGTFDDCQDLVKAMFNDIHFRDRLQLSAVNSINWGRILAQIVYYVAASQALGGSSGRPVRFVVPSGNFGNVYAGFAATQMGLPVERLVVATNTNNILTRFFAKRSMEICAVIPSLSPSMDIQVSSNAERLMFHLMGNDGAGLAHWMGEFRSCGQAVLPPIINEQIFGQFASGSVDDNQTLAMIGQLWRDAGMLVDPHTAVGLAVAKHLPAPPGVPTVVLSTAHPAKFPDAVMAATGQSPPQPPEISRLLEQKERIHMLENNVVAVQAYIAAHARITGGCAE